MAPHGIYSGQIISFEFLPCAVAYVEDLHFLLPLHNAVEDTIDMGFGAVEQVPEALVLRCDRAAVGVVSQAANGMPKTPIPVESGGRGSSANPMIEVNQVPSCAGR